MYKMSPTVETSFRAALDVIVHDMDGTSGCEVL